MHAPENDSAPRAPNVYPPRSGIRPQLGSDDARSLVRQLRDENRALREETVRLREQLSHMLVDPVTGVCGRRYFDRRLRQEMYRTDRHGQPLGLVIVDIAELRTLKETAGEDESDIVLRWVADLVARLCRDCDVPCRISESEFALILPNTPYDGACTLVERLAHNLQVSGDAPVLTGGLSVGLRFGVSAYPEHAETLLELVFEAEESML